MSCSGLSSPSSPLMNFLNSPLFEPKLLLASGSCASKSSDAEHPVSISIMEPEGTTALIEAVLHHPDFVGIPNVLGIKTGFEMKAEKVTQQMIKATQLKLKQTLIQGFKERNYQLIRHVLSHPRPKWLYEETFHPSRAHNYSGLIQAISNNAEWSPRQKSRVRDQLRYYIFGWPQSKDLHEEAFHLLQDHNHSDLIQIVLNHTKLSPEQKSNMLDKAIREGRKARFQWLRTEQNIPLSLRSLRNAFESPIPYEVVPLVHSHLATLKEDDRRLFFLCCAQFLLKRPVAHMKFFLSQTDAKSVLSPEDWTRVVTDIVFNDFDEGTLFFLLAPEQGISFLFDPTPPRSHLLFLLRLSACNQWESMLRIVLPQIPKREKLSILRDGIDWIVKILVRSAFQYDERRIWQLLPEARDWCTPEEWGQSLAKRGCTTTSEARNVVEWMLDPANNIPLSFAEVNTDCLGIIVQQMFTHSKPHCVPRLLALIPQERRTIVLCRGADYLLETYTVFRDANIAKAINDFLANLLATKSIPPEIWSKLLLATCTLDLKPFLLILNQIPIIGQDPDLPLLAAQYKNEPFYVMNFDMYFPKFNKEKFFTQNCNDCLSTAVQFAAGPDSCWNIIGGILNHPGKLKEAPAPLLRQIASKSKTQKKPEAHRLVKEELCRRGHWFQAWWV